MSIGISEAAISCSENQQYGMKNMEEPRNGSYLHILKSVDEVMDNPWIVDNSKELFKKIRDIAGPSRHYIEVEKSPGRISLPGNSESENLEMQFTIGSLYRKGALLLSDNKILENTSHHDKESTIWGCMGWGNANALLTSQEVFILNKLYQQYCVFGELGICVDSDEVISKRIGITIEGIQKYKVLLSVAREKLEGGSFISIGKRYKENGERDTDVIVFHELNLLTMSYNRTR
jgi:hypothetical protein